VAGLCLAGLGIGCSQGNDDSPPREVSHYFGVYAEYAGLRGTIELAGTPSLGQGQPPNAIDLSGELRLAGQAAIPLAGIYYPDAGIISFGCDSPLFSFWGHVVAGKATGGSGGSRGAGSWAAFQGGTPSTIQTYCSTVVCTSPSPAGCWGTGSADVAVSGSDALVAWVLGGTLGADIGTTSADSVDFQVVQPESGIDIGLHGDIDGTDISGTWTDNINGYAGTWGGTTAQCSAAGFRR
jgi:hypothetical protein